MHENLGHRGYEFILFKCMNSYLAVRCVRCRRLFGEGVNVVRRPCPLRLLRSRPDFLPVGGVAVPPPTIRVHGSRFPPPSSSCSRRPPRSPACLCPRQSASFPTSFSHQSDPSAPFCRCCEKCSLLLNWITPSPTPTSASSSRPCSSRLRRPLRWQRPPPTPPPPSSSTLVDC